MSGTYVHRLPDLGEGLTHARLLAWHVKPGEHVAEDEELLELETDKATVVVTSPVAGEVVELCAAEEQEVRVGAKLVVLRTVEPVPATPTQAETRATPRARRLARELGVDLQELAISGRHVIDEADVRLAAEQTSGARASGKERLVAHLERSHREVPAVTVVEEADVTEVHRVRGARTWLAYVVSAVGAALERFPELNGHYRDGASPPSSVCDLAIAVQTERGLVAPVLRDPCRGVDELDELLRVLVRDARADILPPQAYRDATLTITSAGRFGGIVATPLVMRPQVATVGFYRVTERPGVVDGQIVARHHAYLSCSFDHRAVDGHRAAGFLTEIASLLGTPTQSAARSPADAVGRRG